MCQRKLFSLEMKVLMKLLPVKLKFLYKVMAYVHHAVFASSVWSGPTTNVFSFLNFVVATASASSKASSSSVSNNPCSWRRSQKSCSTLHIGCAPLTGIVHTVTDVYTQARAVGWFLWIPFQVCRCMETHVGNYKYRHSLRTTNQVCW